MSKQAVRSPERGDEMQLTPAQHRSVQLQILRIMRRFAPTSTAMRKLNATFLDTKRTWKGNPARCTRAIVGILSDGLTYGNWPWADFTAGQLVHQAFIRHNMEEGA